MVTLTIDDQEVSVEAGTTVIEAARRLGIHIPTLCHYPELNHAPGACRVCLVEVTRSRNLVASCVYPVANGIRVKTNSARVRKARKTVVELMLSDHPDECNTCLTAAVNCRLSRSGWASRTSGWITPISQRTAWTPLQRV